METRMITQVKVYVLWMNPISGRAEDTVPVAVSTESIRLFSWYNEQTCPMYNENGMNKFFRKGTVLELYNPITTSDINPGGPFHHGVYTEWLTMYDGIDSVVRQLESRIIWLG